MPREPILPPLPPDVTPEDLGKALMRPVGRYADVKPWTPNTAIKENEDGEQEADEE